MRTQITFTPGRQQSYSIWYEDQIVRFERDPDIAEQVLADYQQNGPPVDRKTIYNRNRRKDEF